MIAILRKIYSDTGLSVILGIGLVLLSLHSEWFIYHQGEKTLIFLPQWGFLMMAIVAGTLYLNKRFTREHLKPYPLTIAMALLVGFTVIACLVNWDSDQAGNALFIACMPMFYLSARVLGKRILWPLVIASVIEAISVIVYVLAFADWDSVQQMTNGGLLSETNYALGTAFIALGTACGFYLIRNVRWFTAFLFINTLGMLFTGSPESFIIIGLIGAFIILKRYWHREYAVAFSLIVVIMVSWFVFGAGQTHYDRVSEVIGFATDGKIAKAELWEYSIITDKESNWIGCDDSTEPSWGQGRLPAYKRAINNISMFGHGYYVYEAQRMDNIVMRTAKVHNVPLVTLDQAGIVPFLTWILITGYCLLRYRWKALWLCLIALGLFNHTTWTVFAPYWWIAIGLTMIHYKEDTSQPDIKYQSELLVV